MKVLWITNILFPEAERELTGISADLKSSGGWMLGASQALASVEGIDLYVAAVSSLVDDLTEIRGENITYYVIPIGKGNLKINDDYMPYWQQIKKTVNPDIVHIHGTEYSHSYAYLKACGGENTVISIQGLLHAYHPYYEAGLSLFDILSNITLSDLRRGGIIRKKDSFRRRSAYEIASLHSVNHVIGRTSWDRARVWAVNPCLEYHHCNETLRPEFYDSSLWTSDACERHSIFLSSAAYPIKGFHQVLRALPLVLRKYPDAIVRVAGEDITSKGMTVRSGYGRYLRKLIRKYGLEDKVFFTGTLSGEEMKKHYLKANVFICPSSIENSPNSLGEAQILGVPCIASDVGGVMDMMSGCENFTYRFEEIELLADKICMLFEDPDAYDRMALRESACRRHDALANAKDLLACYERILSRSCLV